MHRRTMLNGRHALYSCMRLWSMRAAARQRARPRGRDEGAGLRSATSASDDI